MKLIASLIVRNEVDRYLEPCVTSLLEFCDELRVLDDFSDDGTYQYLLGTDRVYLLSNHFESFFEHEGKARQRLLEWTLEGDPSHVLAIDADELVTDGKAVRDALEHQPEQPVWTLKMEEVWKIDSENLWIRNDGGWRPHEIPCLWRVPNQLGGLAISDRALACGREPEAVRDLFRRSIRTGESILHFGWTQESARSGRYQRYVDHDGGQFHANAHIQSIMWPDKRVRMQGRPWPSSLMQQRDSLLSLSSR